MKVLILSSNTGAGHNACAAAIQEELMERHIPCDIRDGLSFLSKEASHFISEWHVRLYRTLPKLYGEGYSYAEKHAQSMSDDSIAYRFLASGARRLRAYIVSQGYTDIVCTHLFPAMMLSQIQRSADAIPVRTAFIATDYTASPGYESICTDLVFIPSPTLTDDFVKADIPASRIFGTGIPVRKAFHTVGDKAAAKRALGINPDHRHLLVMSGSMGCGPLKHIMKHLSRNVEPDVEISVICGTNRKLSRQLNRLVGDRENLHIHDFVDHISLFMDSADLFLTKPGGLSVSEALAKRLPMVLIQAVEGCETYNMRFCLSHGAAVTADDSKEIAALCLSLIKDDDRLDRIRRQMESACTGRPAVEFCDRLLDAEV